MRAVGAEKRRKERGVTDGPFAAAANSPPDIDCSGKHVMAMRYGMMSVTSVLRGIGDIALTLSLFLLPSRPRVHKLAGLAYLSCAQQCTSLIGWS